MINNNLHSILKAKKISQRDFAEMIGFSNPGFIKALQNESLKVKDICFHVARHTFATLAIRLKIPIEVVSKFLGHSNIKQTEIYAKIMDESKENYMALFDQI